MTRQRKIREKQKRNYQEAVEAKARDQWPNKVEQNASCNRKWAWSAGTIDSKAREEASNHSQGEEALKELRELLKVHDSRAS